MKKWLMAAAFLVTALLTGGVLLYTGVLQLNHPSRERYPVRGVDVSSYQGEVDWPLLASQDIQFAFIKATEGSSLQDPCFDANWEAAAESGLRVGAYHFFSFDSPGNTQAELFIRTVKPVEHMLPPVVDVEFYGDKAKNPPEAKEVEEQLTVLLNALEAQYGVKPILYVTSDSYARYIKGRFDAYDLWIRSVYTSPGREPDWAFWQYSNRMVLDGYQGEERFIDMNVFKGTQAEFEHYGQEEGNG